MLTVPDDVAHDDRCLVDLRDQRRTWDAEAAKAKDSCDLGGFGLPQELVVAD